MPRNLICPKCKEKPKHCKCNLLAQLKNANDELLENEMQIETANELIVNLYNISKFPKKEASLIYIKARDYIKEITG